ncbi:MAG: BON domain-containing protein [Elainellaceae cyanobacterium]
MAVYPLYPWKLASAALTATILTTTAACSEPQVNTPQPEDSPQNVAVNTDQDISDIEITDAVNEEFRAAQGVPVDEIQIETNQGVVTLLGTVNNILAKDRAQRITEMVLGVRSVINRIEVAPSERDDAAITADVLTTFAADPATESWELSATTEDGIVTLTGTVDSWQEQQLATRIAKGIRGVQGIENEIDVSYEVFRSDAEIQEEVERAIEWDARINAGEIDVAVDDGIVTLNGLVGSAYEKSLAVADAYVAGVRSVDDAELDVEPGLQNTPSRTTLLSSATDSDIQNAVTDALLYDPRVSSFAIDVTVDEGVATLTGTVDNLKSKRAAAQDAANTVGVWHVENNIRVEAGAEIADERLSSNITEALSRDPYVEAREILVSVNDGVVTLTGVVDSYFEKWQAGDLAARIAGVVSIDNNLAVDYEQLSFDVDFYDWDPIANDFDYRQFAKTDTELANDILDSIYWSPYVETEGVNVSVEDGVATLTGTVETWYERNEATEEAFEAGASAVVNQLDVNYGPETSS